MPEHPRNLVGPQLRRFRNEHGLSQAAFAAKCQRMGWDITRDVVNKIERRSRWVSDIELVMLARCLGVEMATLLPSRERAEKLARTYLAT